MKQKEKLKGKYLEELNSGFVEKMKKIEKQDFVRVDDFTKRYGLK